MATWSDDSIVAALRKGVPNPLTLKTYLSRLERLKREMGAPDPGRALPALRRDARSATNLVTAVLAVFKHCAAIRRVCQAQQAAWSTFHGELRKAEDGRYRLNRPVNERQEANYVSIDEVADKLAELIAKPRAGLKESMAALLMAFYAYLTPKRSDLGALRLYRRVYVPPPRQQERGNFVVWGAAEKKGVLVIRRHKTGKEIIEEMPPELVTLLEDSLVRHPRTHIFVDRSGRPFTNNGYTKYVIHTLAAHFDGRAAGTSLLRHAYVSERIDFNLMSLAERQEIARLMGHSADTQATMYKWVGRRCNARRLNPIVCHVCGDKFDDHLEYDRHMRSRHADPLISPTLGARARTAGHRRP